MYLQVGDKVAVIPPRDNCYQAKPWIGFTATLVVLNEQYEDVAKLEILEGTPPPEFDCHRGRDNFAKIIWWYLDELVVVGSDEHRNRLLEWELTT